MALIASSQGTLASTLFRGKLYFRSMAGRPKTCAKVEEEKEGMSEPGTRATDLLAIMSIPNSKSPTEFQAIFTPYESKIASMRILKSSFARYYTIIVHFADSKDNGTVSCLLHGRCWLI